MPALVTDTSVKEVEAVIRGDKSDSSKQLPPMDLLLIILTPDIILTEYYATLQSLIRLANENNIPPLCFVTKLDTVDARTLPTLFSTIAQNLGLRRELILPLKNIIDDKHSELLYYFALRVLDKTLAYLQYFDSKNVSGPSSTTVTESKNLIGSITNTGVDPNSNALKTEAPK